MIPADVEALALADIAGALEADEQRMLQARLAELAPDVQAQVARLYHATLALVENLELTPPPALRDRVLAAVRTPATYTVPAGESDWTDTPLPGIRVKVLAVDHRRGLVTMLLRGEPGAVYPAHRHSAPEECYVIRGSVEIGGRVLHAGDFHHADADSDHGAITTAGGAEVLLIGAIDDYLPGASNHG